LLLKILLTLLKVSCVEMIEILFKAFFVQLYLRENVIEVWIVIVGLNVLNFVIVVRNIKVVIPFISFTVLKRQRLVIAAVIVDAHIIEVKAIFIIKISINKCEEIFVSRPLTLLFLFQLF